MSQPEQVSSQARTRKGVMRFLKRQMKRLLRRESKRIAQDHETETNPKRRFLGYW